jgi:hypothetical protein
MMSTPTGKDRPATADETAPAPSSTALANLTESEQFASASPEGALEKAKEDRDLTLERTLNVTAEFTENLILRFSQPASRISGALIGLVGLLLIVATLVLGVTNMLEGPEFVATMIAGAVLSVAGPFAIHADNAGARDAAAAVTEKLLGVNQERDEADALKRSQQALKRGSETALWQ